MAKVGNRIASIRKAKGLTQQQLAELVDVHWITISKLERGRTQLTDTWMSLLANALGVDEFDLLDATKPQMITIEGDLVRGRNVEENADKLALETIELQELVSAAGSWYRVSDETFEPFFHIGDLLHFAWVTDVDFKRYVGRLCVALVIYDVPDEQKMGRRIEAGILHGSDGKMITLRLLNGVMISGIAIDALGVLFGSRASFDVALTPR